jgi:hypothetical protein
VIGFGRFAGYAGMIDLMRGLGDRMLGLGYTNPFLGMGFTDYYHRYAVTHSVLTLIIILNKFWLLLMAQYVLYLQSSRRSHSDDACWQ